MSIKSSRARPWPPQSWMSTFWTRLVKLKAGWLLIFGASSSTHGKRTLRLLGPLRILSTGPETVEVPQTVMKPCCAMSPRPINVAIKNDSPKRSLMFFNLSTTRKKMILKGLVCEKTSSMPMVLWDEIWCEYHPRWQTHYHLGLAVIASCSQWQPWDLSHLATCWSHSPN